MGSTKKKQAHCNNKKNNLPASKEKGGKSYMRRSMGWGREGEGGKPGQGRVGLLAADSCTVVQASCSR